MLHLHCDRAHYLASIWRRANRSRPIFPDSVHYGWNSDKSILWVNDIFPDEIESILVDDRYDPDDVNDAIKLFFIWNIDQSLEAILA